MSVKSGQPLTRQQRRHRLVKQRQSAYKTMTLHPKKGQPSMRTSAASAPAVAQQGEQKAPTSASVEQPKIIEPAQPQAAAKPKSLGQRLMLTLIRLAILGVGMGAIAGMTLTIAQPNLKFKQANRNPAAQPSPAAPKVFQLHFGSELTATKQQILRLAAAQPKLSAGMFFLNLDTGAYLDSASTSIFSAASTIKFPVLVALFQDIDAGKVSFSEQLVMRSDLIGSGAGDMQYKKPGSKFTLLETATKMMSISDNTATNMIIDRLGGATVLNQRFKTWGLKATVIRNPLPDLSGTNTTSPRELAALMAQVVQSDLVSAASRDRLLNIMRQSHRNTLLPQGLGKGATMAHKTGDIGSLVGDTGLVQMPNGQRYVAAVLVKRPHNNFQAKELIRQISRLTYQAMAKPAAKPQP